MFHLSQVTLATALGFFAIDCQIRSSYLSIPQNTHCNSILAWIRERRFLCTLFLTSEAILAWKMQLLELLLSQTSTEFAMLQYASTNLAVEKVEAKLHFPKPCATFLAVWPPRCLSYRKLDQASPCNWLPTTRARRRRAEVLCAAHVGYDEGRYRARALRGASDLIKAAIGVKKVNQKLSLFG